MGSDPQEPDQPAVVDGHFDEAIDDVGDAQTLERRLHESGGPVDGQPIGHDEVEGLLTSRERRDPVSPIIACRNVMQGRLFRPKRPVPRRAQRYASRSSSRKRPSLH